MKFNVSSKTFYSYVSAVSKVMSSKNAMSILNNFHFNLKGNELTVTASDTENTMMARLEVADAEGEGSFCVDARRLVDLLRELPDAGISVSINPDTMAINIEYGGAKFDFVGIPGNQYPSIISQPKPEEILSFECPTEQIISGIDNTLFAVRTENDRPQLMGILLDIKPDAITFVATDTRKLVKFRNSTSAPGIEGSFILPVKPAAVIKNVFAKEETLKAEIDPGSASFSAGAFTLNCRFIKGNFPDYNKVIPRNNAYSLTVDRVQYLNALRRVAVFVDPAHGLVKFKITPNSLIMKAQDNNFCTLAVETLPCSFSGNELVIGFSAQYLIEFFNTITTDEVVINLADPSRAGIFLPSENKPDCELLMILMPMTVQDF